MWKWLNTLLVGIMVVACGKHEQEEIFPKIYVKHELVEYDIKLLHPLFADEGIPGPLAVIRLKNGHEALFYNIGYSSNQHYIFYDIQSKQWVKILQC